MGIFLCELIAHRLAGLAAYKFNQQRAGIRLLMHAQCRERQHGADGNAQEAPRRLELMGARMLMVDQLER